MASLVIEVGVKSKGKPLPQDMNK